MDGRSLLTSADESHSPRNNARLWLGFLMMPPVSALGAAVVLPIVAPGEPGAGGSGVFAFVAAIAAVLVTPAGALPAFLVLKRRGPITLSQTLCAGAALGNAPGALFALMAALFAVAHIAAGSISQHMAPLSSLLTGALRVVVLGTAVGTISAAAFWLIAVRGTDLVE